MKLGEIEERLQRVDLAAGQDLIHELLAAYGTPQSSITKLRNGTYDKAADENEVLWKKKVWDIYMPDSDTAKLLAVLDRAQSSTDIGKLKPRFYIARNDVRLAAVDNRTGQTLDIALTDLQRHAAFFMPWAGAEKVRSETASYIDTKVAQQMAKLYDEVIATNPDLPRTDQGRRDLNLFFSRLLFCFFAEDTGVFEDGIFTDGLNNLTATDGSDTAPFLDELFDVLDTHEDDRKNVPSHFAQFGYVNGSLFSNRISAPNFSRKARNIVVDCGTLDWSSINPDIFGSMIQAVTAGEDRSNLGMHYTSVENILKVLNPLFLDELEERYEAAEDSARQLEELHQHLGEIQVFDPACGSGNFLIVAYKRLRDLEHRILQRLVDLQGGEAPLFADSLISLENFYGIEIDDFAHDIAKLSLWFAKHQMNQEYDELFGIERPLIPLTETGSIQCANAARLDWLTVCEPTDTTYVCGNPPYVGVVMQTAEQKDDLAHHFDGRSFSKKLDYISLWFRHAAEFIRESNSRVAFVSTNSICQGEHASLMWPQILVGGVVIDFAHSEFPWSNSARANAGVICVIIGLANEKDSVRRLYTGSSVVHVENINPYLVPSTDNTVVEKRRHAPADLPSMERGSMATDDGNLTLTSAEASDLLMKSPRLKSMVRPFIGASELIRAEQRSCLWITDVDVEFASEYPEIKRRLEAIAEFRRASSNAGTRELSNRPHQFGAVRHRETPCIAVPRVSSARRSYIPLGIFDGGTVLSDQLYAIYDAEPWLFGLLESSMHMTWVRSTAGRMKSDFRYSSNLCYNTYPFPKLAPAGRSGLADRAFGILAARERWPDRSLAELYDPDKMPANLRLAHEANDAYVDSLYRKKPFASDADRMELLLSMYRDLVAEDEAKNSKSKKKV